MMFKSNKIYLVFSIIALAIFSITSCKSSYFQAEAPTAQQPQIQPQSAPPVLADGSRTSYADIVDRVAPAVVKVSIEHKIKAGEQTVSPLDNDFFKGFPGFPQGGPQRPQIERGVGSGVIVSADGTILTNNHVVEGADKINVEMNDHRTFTAKVIGADALSDLAVVKIDANNLPYLNLGDSDKVRVGDIVLAIGNPLGIGQTVTSGIISAKGRRTGLSDGKSFEDFLQTDAPINRGNSGGALVNLTGELIGINSQILSSGAGGGSIGIGFSIPSDMAKSVMEQLLKDGKVHRGQLGVYVQNISADLAKTLNLKDTQGVLVSDVQQGGAADKAGLKRGDVVTAINGEKVDDSNILRNRIAQTAPGTEITLTVLRDGKQQDYKAKLGELSDGEAKRNSPDNNGGGQGNGSDEGGKLGLNLQPLTPDIANQLGIPAATKGLVVTDVDPAGAAADAGIAKGDVIVEINRQPVETFEQVKSALEKAGNNPSLLLISRGGRTIYVTVQPNQ
ncbi:MAG: Do family serine endopeptidase [Pyrinomonadaceae bacterium]